jgi:hypothetical protein
MIRSIPRRSMTATWSAALADSTAFADRIALARSTSSSSTGKVSSTTPKKHFERWSDCVPALNGYVAVQDFLENLCVRDQAFPVGNTALEQLL